MNNNESRTFAGVFIKVDVGKERSLIKWIKDIAEKRFCQGCECTEQEKYCQKIIFDKVVLLIGPYDIFIGAKVFDIRSIQYFLINCVRCQPAVLDTRTFMGIEEHIKF